MRVHHSGVRPVRKNATWIRQEIHKSYDTRWSGSHFRSYTSPGRFLCLTCLRRKKVKKASGHFLSRTFPSSIIRRVKPLLKKRQPFEVCWYFVVIASEWTIRCMQQIKQAHEDLFSDVCVFSDVCHILSTCQVRIDSRTFIHEMFDSPFPEVWEDAVAALNRKLADPQQPAPAPSPTATDATPIITTVTNGAV
ncbi:unnamed protein product [Nesidiocoris tenuis]|uniref:Uncharacterized protein n=1 Tax=Nesidiocoris tenuis TaxID=355587 RepID=A0A6H5FW67_9HEMI|nr:unnamed protein product [Nesidiocoris tenuis]